MDPIPIQKAYPISNNQDDLPKLGMIALVFVLKHWKDRVPYLSIKSMNNLQ